MAGPLPVPHKCPNDKTVLETTSRGAWCSHCYKYFQTKWEGVLNLETGEEDHTQLMVEIKDHT